MTSLLYRRGNPPASLYCAFANLVFGRWVIFSLTPELRGGINGLFMVAFVVGGAVGAERITIKWNHPIA